MMELSEIESPIKEHRVTPSDADTADVASVSTSPSSSTSASKPGDWWAFVKANVPSILSIISVLTNVIILSALIPSMKQDIAFMQGQTSTLQRQSSDVQASMSSLQSQVNSATGTLATFTGQIASIQASFNQTESTIMALKASTEQDLGQMRLQASDILSNFRNSSEVINAQMNHTFILAAAQEATLTLRANKTEAQVNEAEARVQILLLTLDTVSNNSMASLLNASSDASSQLSTHAADAISSIATLNTTVINQMTSIAGNVSSSTQAAAAQVVSGFQAANASYFASYQSLSSQVWQITGTLQNQSQSFAFTPVVTSASGSPSIAVTTAKGRWSRIGAMVFYTFQVGGTCSGSPAGDLLVSIPVPNQSDMYQTGTIYAFMKGGAYQGSPHVTMMTATGDGSPNWVRVYNSAGPNTESLINGEYQVIGSVAYVTSAP